MKMFVAFALLIAACYAFDITQFHKASLPQCFMQLLDTDKSKSRLGCLQMCRNRCIFVKFETNSGLCNRYQYGTTSNCAAGNINYVNVYKKVSSYVYNIPVEKFRSWYEAQQYCIDLGGCLAGNDSNLDELNLAAVSNQISGPQYWIGARKLDGLGWIWLNGDTLSVTPMIDEPSASCAHVWSGDMHDFACSGWNISQHVICEIW